MSCLQRLKKIFFKSSSTKTWKSNYIPKDATQQDTFLSKYPRFDGRGIKIAIIDSGFDVSLDGFQQTSEGLPKIIDCFDFTGNGDVDTSEIREMKYNILIGLSGRKLKIPKKWINPSGKWHLGLKSLYKPTMSKVVSDICKKLPEIDCIVWFNGRKWCACIETYGNNLEKARVLTNFRDQHEYGILKLEGLEMAYCISIHNNGDLLEIFMAYEDHGSVVAQIAASHYPANPERDDGLAPGAQLIFMTVMAPTDRYAVNLKAVKKALLKCVEMKVDVINLSILSFEGDEEITKLINEMVNLHNILFFKCAGNSGPFYASVYKCDKDIEDVIFKIGAAVTPEMKKQIYNFPIDDKCPPVLYPFSSRGPGASTSQGLDFVVPGGSITFFMQNDDEKDTVLEREIDLSKFLQILPGKAVTEKWTLEIFPKKAESFIELLSKIDENNKFKIKIDTKNLEQGSLNFAEILVIDPLIGSIYSIPVNIIYVLKVTETHNYCFKKDITLIYENPFHLIFYPDFEKSDLKKCDIKITSLKPLTKTLCVQYLIQDTVFVDSKNVEDNNKKDLKFSPKNCSEIYSMPVVNKAIHELCIYQAIGASSNVKFTLEFNFKNDDKKAEKKH